MGGAYRRGTKTSRGSPQHQTLSSYTPLAMLGLSASCGLSRRSLLYLGGGSEEGDELPDVGETF
jgi:hypothetical protein